MILEPGVEIDMSALRRRCLVLLWVLTPAFLSLCQVPWFAAAMSQGWPGLRFRELDKLVFYSGISISVVFTNLPDFVSIALYVIMLLHFRKKNVVHVVEQQEVELEEFEHHQQQEFEQFQPPEHADVPRPLGGEAALAGGVQSPPTRRLRDP